MYDGVACTNLNLFSFNLINVFIWLFIAIIIYTLYTRRKIIIRNKITKEDMPFVLLGSAFFAFITYKFANCQPGYILGSIGTIMFFIYETTGGLNLDGIIYKNSVGLFKINEWSDIENIKIEKSYYIKLVYEVSGEIFEVNFNIKHYNNLIELFKRNNIEVE